LVGGVWVGRRTTERREGYKGGEVNNNLVLISLFMLNLALEEG
jgi:hypothetical protein